MRTRLAAPGLYRQPADHGQRRRAPVVEEPPQATERKTICFPAWPGRYPEPQHKRHDSGEGNPALEPLSRTDPNRQRHG